MKILDYTIKYTTYYSAQRFSVVCEKNKKPTLEELLFYYVTDKTPDELQFFLDNRTPNVNHFNLDRDTAIMWASMYFSLSNEMKSMLEYYEKIKILNQQKINYMLINVEGENIVNNILMSPAIATDNSNFDKIKYEKAIELVELLLTSGAPLDYKINRSQWNTFDMPAYLAKDDRYHWSLKFLIKKGLDVNCFYQDEDGNKARLLDFAKQNEATKNSQLIFENTQECLEKKALEVMILNQENHKKLKQKL